MKKHINANTVANTVRMGARSKRPKAIFLASDQTDVELVQAVLSSRECRIIPAQSRENAVQAFEILVKSGWEGVVTAVNSRFAQVTEHEVLADVQNPAVAGVTIEGIWEEIVSRSSVLNGQRVSVTVLEEPPQHEETKERTNTDMLQALTKIGDLLKDLKPKQDRTDYLREAREGAMYGLNDD